MSYGVYKTYTYVFIPDVSVVKNPSANTGDTGLIPGSGRSPGRGNANTDTHTDTHTGTDTHS